MGMDMDNIRSILGEPIYDGPLNWLGHILEERVIEYEIENISVSFYSASHYEPCRFIVFRNYFLPREGIEDIIEVDCIS